MTRPVLVAALLLAESASAYVLYTSPNFSLVPLRWRETDATVVMDSGAPEELEAGVARQAVRDSFAVWTDLTCDAGGSVGWVFDDGGLVSGRSVGFDDAEGAQNENLVIWVRDGWAHDKTVVALTSLTFDVYTGTVVDADIELNDQRFRFSLAPSISEMDVQNTLVHEIGHFIGLDHSKDPAATMFSTAPTGETKKRTLTDDDVAGACALYGPEAAPFPEVTGRIPPKGQESSCAQVERADGSILIDCPGTTQAPNNGCTASPAGASPTGAAGVLLALFLLAIIRRAWAPPPGAGGRATS